MTKKGRIILIAGIVLLILAMAFFPRIKRALWGNSEADDVTATARQQRGPLNVNALVLNYDDLVDYFISFGILYPDEEVELSFETSGKITNIYFTEGREVRKGDLLAKINDGPLQAELRRLEVQLPLAQDRLSRQQQLLEREAVSRESYQSVATELEKLQADIELVKARIAQTELRAPFDGIVGLRRVSEGAFASPSTVLAHLTKIRPLKLDFSVNERQASELRPGRTVMFTTDNSTDELHEAEVYAVESSIDRATLSFRGRALYPNANGRLKPGTSASVRLRLQNFEESIMVPAIAVVAEMGRDIVYVYRDGAARQIQVRKDMRTESSVQILDGLSYGDTLITSGVMQLRDGMAVSLNRVENNY
ncbi:MAG: efflux RND transporter periplasmic adaptor subunit [Rikenellaceae bacterium]|nr:efflux RND transporter periplasmic adaptor subunit [Rikenellaceae bacterium]MCL2692367.1 efflux RND transporter periplasmic adaptor subunit [Rikenellaceae bacterium]